MTRPHLGSPQAHFVAQYRPISPVTTARRSTLEYWLAERYCLYTLDKHNQVYRGNIHHRPWPLQQAELSIASNSMGLAHGIHLPDHPPLLHYAQRQEVLVWPLRLARECA